MKRVIFSGMLVLVCCLFGGVEVAEALNPVDISGKCVDISSPERAGAVSGGNLVCRSAGYGDCASTNVAATLQLFNDTDCGILTSSMPMAFGCDTLIFPTTKSAIISDLFCEPRTWGIIPQPDNVPGDFEQSIKSATDWILGFVGMIAVLMLVWGGINYLTSAGDEDKARTGKKTISYAIMGLVIAGIAYALVNVIITVIL